MMRPPTPSGHARQHRAGSLVQTLVAWRDQGATMGGMVRGPRSLQVVVICVLAIGMIVGLGTVWLGWLAPSFSRAASSLFTSAWMCAAGWSLMLAGAISLWRGGGRTKGVALMAAGFGWFMSEWANPASAPAIVFTAGLLSANAWPALLAHAILDAGSSTGSGLARRSVVTVAYITNVGLLGIVPTLSSIPSPRDARCAGNLVALASDPGLVTGSTRLGLWLEAVWVVGALTLIVRGLVRTSATERRRTAAVEVACGDSAGGGGPRCRVSIPRGSLSNNPVIWCFGPWPRSPWLRSDLARVPAGCADARPDSVWPASPSSWRPLPRPASWQWRSAESSVTRPSRSCTRSMTGDWSMRPASLGWRLSIPCAARPTFAAASPRSQILVHRADLARDGGRIADAVDAARLALENERLHAQSQARLLELRTSRAPRSSQPRRPNAGG